MGPNGVDIPTTRTGFEQFFVLTTRPVGPPLRLSLPLRTTGVTARTDADGNTALVDSAGTVVGSVPAADMSDARRDPGSGDPVLRTHVAQGRAVAGAPGRLDLTVTPDPGFLADPARQYPVTIDPGVTIWTTFDTFTESDIVNTDQSGQPELRIGSYNGGTVKARSYLTFNTSAFRGTRILSAKLWLYETWSYSCSARPWEVWSSLPVGTGTRWSNQPAPANIWASSSVTLGHDAGCNPNWIGTDIRSLQQGWADGNIVTGTMLLKAQSETDSFGWKKFSSAEGGAVPHIDVTYNTRPNPATGLQVSDRGDTAGVTYTRSLTPTLSFTPSDPDGNAVTAVFYVYDGDTMIYDRWIGGVPSGSVATWKVPPGLLVAGHSYRFRATTFDATDFANDAWLALKSVRSGQNVDVASCGTTNGTRVQQWPANGADCQRFFPWGTGDGYYQFKVRHSGQVLDNSGCATADANPIKTYDQVSAQAANDCQQWSLNRLGAGTGVYSFTVLNAGKAMDQGCSTTNATVIYIWTRLDNVCQQFRMDPNPVGTTVVNWLPFTVDTAAPGAPAVSSTDYPNDNTWHLGAGQPGVFHFSVAGSDTASFLYGVDATPTTEVTAAADGTANPSITPTADGAHLLNVRTKDKAGNLSAVVSYAFQAGRAGLVSPTEGARVVNRMALRVQGDPVFTHVKFVWRRGPGAAVETDIPAPNLTTATGGTVAAGYVPLSGLGGSATWNAVDTLGSGAGVVQVKAVLATDATGTGAYATQWRTAVVDPSADGAASEDIGGGSVNLLTGDFALSSSDAEEFGLSVSRTASSRDPRAGYQTQRERLTVNQQTIATDTTGFVGPTTTLTRSTTRGHSATDSLTLTPAAGATSTDTFAAPEADAGALRLGMAAGHTYRYTGWVYVPAATGLAVPDPRGLRLTAHFKVGGVYQDVSSARPTVTDAWVQLSLDFTVPAGATEAFVRLYNGYPLGSGKQVHYDDLSLRELTAPFGPQWQTGAAAESAGIDYTRLTFPEPNIVRLEQVDGSDTWFTKAADGRLFPEPGAADLSLIFDGTNYVLTEIDGTVTVFSKATIGDSYMVASTSPPTQAATTRYIYESVGDQVRIKRAIGPAEPGVGDCTLATPARGCESIDYDYATTTTATATTFGDVAGQVRGIGAWSTDPATGVVSRIEVTRYAYDNIGQLRQVWDPRLATPLVTGYTYDPAGRIIQVNPPGELPWSYDYGAAGTGDTNAGRLLRAHRDALKPGTLDVSDGQLTTAVVYGVPLTRTAGGPYDLDGATAATWAQTDVPTDATAIFGPEDPVTVSTATSAVPGPDGYGPATVHYLDASGHEVNTAAPGGWIDTTEFDRFDNAVRTLESANRALALRQGAGAQAALADLGLDQADSATVATWLDTQTGYSIDGVDQISSLTPLERLASDTDPTLLVNARRHSVTTYDEGKPDGTVYHLPTTSQSGAQVVGLAGEQDVRVTRTDYTPAIGGTSGWTIRAATKITADADAPAGAVGPAVTVVRYDDQGRARESRKIDATGTDAGTTLSVFYTAGANPDDTSCANRPEWAGQPCLTKAGGLVTGHDPARMVADLPMKRVESYTRFGETEKTTETAAGQTRSTVTSYDGAGRVTGVAITGSVGTAVPAVTTTFDPATGHAVTTQLGDGSTIGRVFDKLGRLTRYTDADGAWTATEFDRIGRPGKITDSVGSTQTFTYDRAVDPRGLLTSITDSVAGTISARYGPDGQIVGMDLPGGIRLGLTLDPAGTPTSRTYTRISDGVQIAASAVIDNLRGQVVRSTGPASDKQFSYDRWSRLTRTEDTSVASGACTTRLYTYDRRSNRTGKTTRGGADAACPPDTAPTIASESHTYDSGDRITDPGNTFDAFGRMTVTPSVTNTFYVNDMVQSQTAGTARKTWTLDPTQRLRGFTSESLVNGAWANAVSKINHYGADGDDPRWIAEDTTQATNLTRNVESPEGTLAATTGQTGGVALQLTSLHGDVMATVPVDPATNSISGAVTVLDSDEFGIPSTDTPAAATARYSWLGGEQRSAEALGGTILMGARLYHPGTGRFLSTDPDPGGNATAYDYCGADPINCTDLSGHWGWLSSVLNVVARVAEVASWIPGPIGSVAAGISAIAYAGTGNWSKAGEMAVVGLAGLVGANTAVKAGFGLIRAASRFGARYASRAWKAGRAAQVRWRQSKNISFDQQSGHIRGTHNYLNRMKQGKFTSHFHFGRRWANIHTRLAWTFGRQQKQSHIRIAWFPWHVGRAGPGGRAQRHVRVSMKKGYIHGTPWG